MESIDLLANDIYNIQMIQDDCKKIVGTRRHRACIIKGLPDKTTVKELEGLLQRLVPGISITSMHIHHPHKPKSQMKCIKVGVIEEIAVFYLQAFVRFNTDDDCKRVVEFFHEYTISNIGFEITNSENVTGRIYVHFMYTTEGCDFYLRKMLKTNDISNLPKEDKTVLFYHVPEKATEEEMGAFIRQEVPNISGDIQNVSFLRSYFSSKKKAIVTMASNEDRDAVVNFFKFYNESGMGYTLSIDSNTASSGIFASYFFLKTYCNDEDKKKNEIVLYNVPNGTHNTELQKLIENIYMPVSCTFKWVKNWGSDNSIVFVTFETGIDCGELIGKINIYHGYTLKNWKGVSAVIRAGPSYLRKLPFNSHESFERLCKKLMYRPPLHRCKNKICIYNIPDDIEKDEIELFLVMIDPAIKVKQVVLEISSDSWHKAFVTLTNDVMCWKLVNFFAPVMHSCNGYELQSQSGKTSKVLVRHVYRVGGSHNVNKEKEENVPDMLDASGDKLIEEDAKTGVESPAKLVGQINRINSLLAASNTSDTRGMIITDIPVDTLADEVTSLITAIECLSAIKLYGISFMQKKSIILALVEMDSSTDCRKVVDYFNQHHILGYRFQNKQGKVGMLQFFVNQDDDLKGGYITKTASMFVDEVMILGVPNDTSKGELRSFLEKVVPGINIARIWLSNTRYCMKVFLQVKPCDREAFINYFQSCPGGWCHFENEKGKSGRLVAKYCFSNKRFTEDVEEIDRFVIHGVPVETDTEEIRKYIEEVLTGLEIENVFLKKYNFNNSCLVLVKLKRIPSSIDEVIKKVNKHNLFCNSSGQEGELKATYHHINATKSDVKFVLKNIPRGTETREIVSIIRNVLPSIVSIIVDVHVVDPFKKNNKLFENETEKPPFYALVEIASESDFSEIFEHFSQFEDGYDFKNKSGDAAKLIVEPYYSYPTESRKTCQNLQIILHNVPPKTTKYDLVTYLGDTFRCMASVDVWIQKSKKGDVMTAILNLRSDAEFDKFLWNVYRNKMETGFVFTNNAGHSSVVTISASTPIKTNISSATETCQEIERAIRGDEVVFSNVPENTTANEIVQLITENVLEVVVDSVRKFSSRGQRKVYVNQKPVTWTRYMLFVRFVSNIHCSALYGFFKSHPHGFWFRNECGESSHLVVNYVYKDLNDEAAVNDSVDEN